MFDTQIFIKAFTDCFKLLCMYMVLIVLIVILSWFISNWIIFGSLIVWLLYSQYTDLKNKKDKCGNCDCNCSGEKK